MTREIKALKSNIASKGRVSDYISLAILYGNRLEYENAARSLLCILKSNETKSTNYYNSNYRPNLQIIIPCGGNASRWDNFLSQPKHLVDVGNNTRLIERTRQQIFTHFGDQTVTLLLDKKSANKYPVLPKTGTIFKNSKKDNNVALEVLSHPEINTRLDLLWIYGDTFFTKDAFTMIANDISRNHLKIRYYGRKHQNADYGNNGGELFAVYTPIPLLQELKDIYLFVKRLYIGTPMYRFSSWEVIAFLSVIQKQGGIQRWRDYATTLGATRIFTEMCSIWKDRSFPDELWVEINDATEDFDYPYEYINWLLRRAHARISTDCNKLQILDSTLNRISPPDSVDSANRIF